MVVLEATRLAPLTVPGLLYKALVPIASTFRLSAAVFKVTSDVTFALEAALAVVLIAVTEPKLNTAKPRYNEFFKLFCMNFSRPVIQKWLHNCNYI